MSSMLPAVIAMVVLLPPPGDVQGKANLSGTWTMVPERSESPEQTPPIRSLVLNISHSDAALNVDTNRDGAAVATSEVAVSLGRKPASLSPARDSLIKKGLVYSAERGQIAFTVPHFGRYLLRHPD